MLLISTIKLLFIQSISSFLSGLKPPTNSWTNRRWPNLEDANKIPSNRWYIDGLETSLHLRKNEVEWAIHHRSTSFPGKTTQSELKKGQSPLFEGKTKADFWPKLRERNARIRKTFVRWVLYISFEEWKKKSQGPSNGFFRGTHNSPNSFPPPRKKTSLIKDLVTL